MLSVKAREAEYTIFKSLVWPNWESSLCFAGYHASQANALTTRLRSW